MYRRISPAAPVLAVVLPYGATLSLQRQTTQYFRPRH